MPAPKVTKTAPAAKKVPTASVGVVRAAGAGTPALLTQAKPPTSWSFSRYGDYKTCPLKFKLKHIDKIAEPKGAAMQRGIDAHDDAEKYIKGTLAKLPDILKPMKSEFDSMRKMYKAKKFPMVVEDNWAFDIKWDETQWNNWAECWVRIKLDAAHYTDKNHLWVTDWKTGKVSSYKNAEYLEQMELYALGALLMSAQADVVVHVRLAWVESGEFVRPQDETGAEIVYTKADLTTLTKSWERRVKPMMSAKNFPPRANGTCAWCWYGQSKKAEGGPGLCKY